MTERVRRPQQGVLEDMLDPEAAAALRDAADPDAFKLVDESLATDYRCPCCGFEWSGQPKPPTSETIE